MLGRSTWWKDLMLLAVAAAIWFCPLLAVRPLSNPDEGRYAEIPREMAVSGDFVTPRLNGVKFFEQWLDTGRSYALLRKAEYEGWFTSEAMPHEVLGESRKLVLVVNRTGNS